jgi:hypothetical protein
MHEATHPPCTADHLAAHDSPGDRFARRIVTAALALIATLTFAFSFGNVWALGIRLGVSPMIAPLVAPAVDLSVVGLLVGIRRLSLHGVSREERGPARRLLVFSGLATLALNIAEPVGDRSRTPIPPWSSGVCRHAASAPQDRLRPCTRTGVDSAPLAISRVSRSTSPHTPGRDRYFPGAG